MSDDNVSGPIRASIRITIDDEAVEVRRNIWMHHIGSDNGYALGEMIGNAVRVVGDDREIFVDNIIAGILSYEDSDTPELATGSIKRLLALFYAGSTNHGYEAQYGIFGLMNDNEMTKARDAVALDICHETETMIDEKYCQAEQRLRDAGRQVKS